MQVEFKFEGVSVVASHPEGWNGKVAFILAHGAGQDMGSPFMTLFHSGIAALGYLAVKFNFPYMEQGRRVPDPQKRLQATYASVIEEVERQFDPKLVIAGGKSMGGRVASYVAADINSIQGLLFLGYPLHPAGKPERLRDNHLYALTQPMLFLSGTRDSLAGKELLDGVVKKIGLSAVVHWLEGGDHSFRCGRNGADLMPRALETIRSWAAQFR